MAEAARRLGMTQQGVGMWAQREGAPIVMKGTRRYCLWPAFPVWHRHQLQREREKPEDFDAAKTRKMAAEAELAEYELEQARGTFVAVSELDARVGPMLDTVRTKLLALPGRLAPRVVACRELPAARALLEEELAVVLRELSG